MWRPDDARERGRQHLLSEAESRIGTNLDPMETAQELAETTVPNLADYVTIDLAEAVPLGSVPLGHLRSTDVSIPGFYRAGVASIHPDLRESLWGRGTPVFVPPRSPFTAVLDSRRSHFEPVLDTSPGTWLDNDPDRARVIHATGMHSLMIVPLQARGAMLGVAVFVRTENATPFTRADLELAEDLAARASLSLDNALRYTRERMAALALQQDLLPHRLSGGSALDVAFRYLPADTHAGVGGDWFDVIPLSRDRVALVVGDVVGHGINAAATMGRLRTMVRTLAKLEVPPDRLLALVDELAVDLTPEPSGEVGPMPPVVGATCVYGVYDPATRHWTLASAGHPPPAIVAPPAPPQNATPATSPPTSPPTPSVTFADLPPGAPIGVGLASFTSIDVELAEGSVIALYSDGLIETRGGDLDEGMERLRAALAHPFRTLDDLCATVVRTQLSGAPTDDDTALLLARTLP
jgi:serine phosphatase RsbU (regulator of sigma subunit)